MTAKARPVRWTPRELRFIEEYLVDVNATQAAIRAGYAAKNADVQGPALLQKPKIRDAIAAHRAKVSEKTGLTVERLDRQLERIAFSDLRKLYDENDQLRPIHTLDDDTAAMVAGFEVEELTAEGMHIGQVKKIKVLDRLKAVELGYKRLGVLRENVALNVGALTIVIQE